MKEKQPAGRNVANIAQLKKTLQEFAKQKDLPDEITQWLNKVLLRWLINSFTDVQTIKSKDQFATLIGEQAPSWFTEKLASTKFIYIDPKHPQLTEVLEKTVEWLGSKYPQLAPKFLRMTVPQILKKWQKDHDYMQRKRANTIETSGEGLTTCFRHTTDNNELFHIVEMLPNHAELSFEMARESSYMQHCLGEFEDIAKAEGGYGEYYYKRIKKQSLRLFSLRDSHNKPHATIALYPKDEQLWVDQIKGKQNAAPVARYVPTVQAFLNHLQVHHNYHSDCMSMGLFFSQGKSLSIEEIKDENTQQLLLTYDSSLFSRIKQPSVASTWLAIMQRPSHIAYIEKPSEAMKIASLLQKTLLLTQLTFESGASARDILRGKPKFKLGQRILRFIRLQPSRLT